PSNVEYLAITVNSFRGQTFNEVQNAFCRVVNDKGVELGRYNLSEQGRHTGVLIASMARNGGDWTFTAHGKACQGRMVQDMLRDILMEIVQ
ncbi:MAG: tellurium resistance TerZ family protein, partial [Aeromonadaceae bacterium]|nr:tellurium resistance TerZ family protein [Aeromonadaceae bacterium]